MVSHTGLVRSKNQDRYLVAPERHLFVVCDGMGGHKGGEVAASLAIDVIDMSYGHGIDPITGLRNAIDTANRLIFTKGGQIPEYHEMGTTLTAAVIDNNRLYVAHVGDSSLYLIKEHCIEKITRDHTLAQQMVDDGILGSAEAKNHSFSHVLTRALGVVSSVDIDFYCNEVREGDYILLATDGLTDLVEDEEILGVVRRSRMEAHRVLVRIALERGGHDNLTVILIQV